MPLQICNQLGNTWTWVIVYWSYPHSKKKTLSVFWWRKLGYMEEPRQVQNFHLSRKWRGGWSYFPVPNHKHWGKCKRSASHNNQCMSYTPHIQGTLLSKWIYIVSRPKAQFFCQLLQSGVPLGLMNMQALGYHCTPKQSLDHLESHTSWHFEGCPLPKPISRFSF